MDMITIKSIIRFMVIVYYTTYNIFKIIAGKFIETKLDLLIELNIYNILLVCVIKVSPFYELIDM